MLIPFEIKLLWVNVPNVPFPNVGHASELTKESLNVVRVTVKLFSIPTSNGEFTKMLLWILVLAKASMREPITTVESRFKLPSLKNPSTTTPSKRPKLELSVPEVLSVLYFPERMVANALEEPANVSVP